MLFHRDLSRIKAAVDRASWTGRTGTSALVVLREHLAVAELRVMYGLAVRQGKTWRQGQANLEDVADRLGLTGAARKQQQRHQRERRAFRQFCIEKRANEGRFLKSDTINPETGEVQDIVLERVVALWGRPSLR